MQKREAQKSRKKVLTLERRYDILQKLSMRQPQRSEAKDNLRKDEKSFKKVLTSELQSDILDKLSRGSTKQLKEPKSRYEKNFKKV